MQPLCARDAFALEAWGDCDAWFEQAVSEGGARMYAAMVLAWYRCSPWSDSELAKKLRDQGGGVFDSTAREMLATLGEAGRRVLEKWDEKEQKKR